MAYTFRSNSLNNAKSTPPANRHSLSSQLLDLVCSNGKNPYLTSQTPIATMMTTSDETTPKSVKSEESLQRKVLFADIIIGPNKKGVADTRLLVPEDSDSNQVREYTKKSDVNNIFYCSGCNNNKKYNYGKIEKDYFFAPIVHVSKCVSISKEEGLKKLKENEQKLIRKGWKSKGIRFLSDFFIENNDSAANVSITSQSSSPQTEMIQNDTLISINEHEESLTSSPDENNLRVKKRSADTSGEEINSIPMKQQKFVSSDAENDKKALSDSALEKRIKSTSNEIYKFNYPSSIWLEFQCKKLQMDYHQNAYKFWGNIDIAEITKTSEPREIQKVKSGKDSSFCALSYLLSGKENENIKTVIKEYFYDNFKSLGTVAGHDLSTLSLEEKIIRDTIFAEEMTPFLWETVAKWLGCRIGIFESDKFLKYGIWSINDEDIFTLIFKKDGSAYSIVMSLDEE